MAEASEAQHSIFEAIRRRRVTRKFSAQPVERELLRRLVEAARWAPSAGNRRIHCFVVVDDALLIHKLRLLAPGMLGLPTALLIICTDWAKAEREGVKANDTTTWMDVGKAAQNVLLAAYEQGLGAGPVTSFSRSGAQTLLHLPQTITPELIVCLGYALPEPRLKRPGARNSLDLDAITFWNYYDR
jgi:nitroreductase